MQGSVRVSIALAVGPLLRASRSLTCRPALSVPSAARRHPVQLRCAAQQEADHSTSAIVDGDGGSDGAPSEKTLSEKSKGMPPRPRFTAIEFNVDKDSAFIDLELRKIQEEARLRGMCTCVLRFPPQDSWPVRQARRSLTTLSP